MVRERANFLSGGGREEGEGRRGRLLHVGWEERTEPRRGGGGRATFGVNTVNNNVNSGISSSTPEMPAP